MKPNITTPHRINASAATTTVLILGSLATVVASFMLLQSTDNAILAKTEREGKQAELAAMSCSEVALEKLRLSTLYAGNETVAINGTLQCTIGAISNTSGSYTIPVSASVGNATKRQVITVGNITTTVNVTEWNDN